MVTVSAEPIKCTRPSWVTTLHPVGGTSEEKVWNECGCARSRWCGCHLTSASHHWKHCHVRDQRCNFLRSCDVLSVFLIIGIIGTLLYTYECLCRQAMHGWCPRPRTTNTKTDHGCEVSLQYLVISSSHLPRFNLNGWIYLRLFQDTGHRILFWFMAKSCWASCAHTQSNRCGRSLSLIEAKK